MKTKDTKNKGVCSGLNPLLPLLLSKTKTFGLRCHLLPLLLLKRKTFIVRKSLLLLLLSKTKTFVLRDIRLLPPCSCQKRGLPGANLRNFTLKSIFCSHCSCCSCLYKRIVALYKRSLKECVGGIYRKNAGATGATGATRAFGVIS